VGGILSYVVLQCAARLLTCLRMNVLNFEN